MIRVREVIEGLSPGWGCTQTQSWPRTGGWRWTWGTSSPPVICSGTSHFLIRPRYVSVKETITRHLASAWVESFASQSFGLLSNHRGPELLSPLAHCLTWVIQLPQCLKHNHGQGSRLVLLTWRHSASQRHCSDSIPGHKAVISSWEPSKLLASANSNGCKERSLLMLKHFHISLQLTHCNKLSV